jgi:hypothetical protein
LHLDSRTTGDQPEDSVLTVTAIRSHGAGYQDRLPGDPTSRGVPTHPGRRTAAGRAGHHGRLGRTRPSPQRLGPCPVDPLEALPHPRVGRNFREAEVHNRLVRRLAARGCRSRKQPRGRPHVVPLRCYLGLGRRNRSGGAWRRPARQDDQYGLPAPPGAIHEAMTWCFRGLPVVEMRQRLTRRAYLFNKSISQQKVDLLSMSVSRCAENFWTILDVATARRRPLPRRYKLGT